MDCKQQQTDRANQDEEEVEVAVVDVVDDFEFDAAKYQRSETKVVSNTSIVLNVDDINVDENGFVYITFSNELTELKKQWEILKAQGTGRRRML